MLQDCFDHPDRETSENNIDIYPDSGSEFIGKCIGNVVHTVTIKTYPNQKPWIDGSILAKLKTCKTAFNHGKATRNMAEYSRVVIPSAKQSNKQNGSIETK